MFAAIFGRFLTSLTAWRLERGVDVAAVEYLTGSRTVFGAISTPFRLRIFHRTLPLLLALWSLSPLGGQASIRMVSLGEVTKSTTGVVYMDVGPDSLTSAANDLASLYGEYIKTIFVGALLTPFDTRDDDQDSFGNLKIPLLEAVYSGLLEEGSNGWLTPSAGQGFPKSSQIGLTTSAPSIGGNTSLNIETSYMYSNCSLKRQNDLGFEPIWEWDQQSEDICVSGNDGAIAMALDADPDYDLNKLSTAPRRIWFRFQNETVECSITTTYVEMNHTCEARGCTPTAIRRSRLQHKAAITWLDGELSNADGAMGRFCSGFISALKLGTPKQYSSSILGYYYLHLGDPFRSSGTGPKLADIDAIDLSEIVTRLLNTYALVYTSPNSVTNGIQSGSARTVTTNAVTSSASEYLKYDQAWLAVLLASSLALCAAGIATVVLNLKRCGPEVLDSFTSLLRDSPYVREETGPSTEDSSEKVRRLRDAPVMLGDVRPMEATGYVAVTTRTDGVSVQPLRRGRSYH
jgi:hypothetical protein